MTSQPRNPSPLIRYAGHTLPDAPPGWTPWLVIVLTGVALAVVTCVRIEVLNAHANFYLPRTDRGTWRTPYLTTEPRWRQRMTANTGDPAWLSRPLSPAERAAMNRDLQPGIANDHLYAVVASWGLLQYPLVAFLTATLGIMLFGHPIHRRTVAVALVLVLICGSLMLYRCYFTSLGW
jgi:hypothetical protein